MTREIPLTQGKVALVDDEDAELVLAHRWCASKDRTTFYAMRASGSRSDGTRKITRLHTFLTGWPLVDHINGNGLDNRRANLRPASHSENLRNQRLSRANTSGYKGVVWHRASKRWHARIKLNGRTISLKYHATPEDAAHAYDAAAVELHGEFARLNFPLIANRRA